MPIFSTRTNFADIIIPCSPSVLRVAPSQTENLQTEQLSLPEPFPFESAFQYTRTSLEQHNIAVPSDEIFWKLIGEAFRRADPNLLNPQTQQDHDNRLGLVIYTHYTYSILRQLEVPNDIFLLVAVNIPLHRTLAILKQVREEFLRDESCKSIARTAGWVALKEVAQDPSFNVKTLRPEYLNFLELAETELAEDPLLRDHFRVVGYDLFRRHYKTFEAARQGLIRKLAKAQAKLTSGVALALNMREALKISIKEDKAQFKIIGPVAEVCQLITAIGNPARWIGAENYLGFIQLDSPVTDEFSQLLLPQTSLSRTADREKGSELLLVECLNIVSNYCNVDPRFIQRIIGEMVVLGLIPSVDLRNSVLCYLKEHKSEDIALMRPFLEENILKPVKEEMPHKELVHVAQIVLQFLENVAKCASVGCKEVVNQNAGPICVYGFFEYTRTSCKSFEQYLLEYSLLLGMADSLFPTSRKMLSLSNFSIERSILDSTEYAEKNGLQITMPFSSGSHSCSFPFPHQLIWTISNSVINRLHISFPKSDITKRQVEYILKSIVLLCSAQNEVTINLNQSVILSTNNQAGEPLRATWQQRFRRWLNNIGTLVLKDEIHIKYPSTEGTLSVALEVGSSRNHIEFLFDVPTLDHRLSMKIRPAVFRGELVAEILTIQLRRKNPTQTEDRDASQTNLAFEGFMGGPSSHTLLLIAVEFARVLGYHSVIARPKNDDAWWMHRWPSAPLTERWDLLSFGMDRMSIGEEIIYYLNISAYQPKSVGQHELAKLIIEQLM